MAVGENQDGSPDTSLLEALKRAKHTLEVLKADEAAGHKVDSDVIAELETVIHKYSSKDTYSQ